MDPMNTMNEHLAMVSRTHRWLRRRAKRLLPKRRHLTAEERVEANELRARAHALHRELDSLLETF